MSRLAALFVFASLVAWLPRAALACSVCYGGEEESRTAFLLTTVFLSVLPLAMIGGLVGWIWRRTRETETGRAPATSGPEPRAASR